MLVVDSSILLSTLLPDEAGLQLADLLASHDDLIAPTLIWVEVRNILLTAERRGRLSAPLADSILKAIDDLGIELDSAPRSDSVLQLARRNALSAYDAMYLELALRRGGQLATLDKALQRAALAEGVEVAR